MISDLEARKLASDWHGGQWSALYSLASTGAINPEHAPLTTAREIIDAIRDEHRPDEHDAELAAILRYVIVHGTRGPVDGWSDLNW